MSKCIVSCLWDDGSLRTSLGVRLLCRYGRSWRYMFLSSQNAQNGADISVTARPSVNASLADTRILEWKYRYKLHHHRARDDSRSVIAGFRESIERSLQTQLDEATVVQIVVDHFQHAQLARQAQWKESDCRRRKHRVCRPRRGFIAERRLTSSVLVMAPH